MMTTTTTASPRQTFALFCATGKDWRSHNLSSEQASMLLANVQQYRGNKSKALEIVNRLLLGNTVDIPALPKMEAKPSMKAIYDEAHKAGLQAVKECNPDPMIIPGYAPIAGGVCGFAWVHFEDGRKPFSKWLVKNNLGSKDKYRGGVTLWAGFEIGNQSLTIKEHYCRAFAAVCQKHGIACRMVSRID